MHEQFKNLMHPFHCSNQRAREKKQTDIGRIRIMFQSEQTGENWFGDNISYNITEKGREWHEVEKAVRLKRWDARRMEAKGSKNDEGWRKKNNKNCNFSNGWRLQQMIWFAVYDIIPSRPPPSWTMSSALRHVSAVMQQDPSYTHSYTRAQG